MHLILYTFEVNLRYYKHLLRAYTIHLDDVFRITIPVWKCFDHLQKTRLPLRVIETKTRRRRNHLIHGIFLLRTCSVTIVAFDPFMVVKKDPLVWELTYSDLHILEHQKLVSLLAIYETDWQFEFSEKVSTENWWHLM